MLSLGLLLSYPFYVVAKKVQYSGFEDKLVQQGKINHNTYKNSFRAIKNLYKIEGGLKAFFAGFIPATIFVLASQHDLI